MSHWYRYSFSADVPIEEVEDTLILALVATEALHGAAQTPLDVALCFDRLQRTCVIDASTQVGRDLNRVFVGFVRIQFGANACHIDRLSLHVVTLCRDPVA